MHKAFTLIEILVVVLIVAILSAIAVPAYNAYIRDSKEKIALSYASAIASAGSPAGYAIGDFSPQSVIWKKN